MRNYIRPLLLLIAGLASLIAGIQIELNSLTPHNLITKVNTAVAKLVAVNQVAITKPLLDFTYVFTVRNPDTSKTIVLSVPTPMIMSTTSQIMVYAVCDNNITVGPKPLSDYTVIGRFKTCSIYVKTPIPIKITVRLV